MPNFVKIAAPLHALTLENVPFFWSMTCQGAFLRLKDHLISPPVLSYPDFGKGFVLHSGDGLGTVLEQVQEDGRSHPVAYALVGH